MCAHVPIQYTNAVHTWLKRKTFANDDGYVVVVVGAVDDVN